LTRDLGGEKLKSKKRGESQILGENSTTPSNHPPGGGGGASNISPELASLRIERARTQKTRPTVKAKGGTRKGQRRRKALAPSTEQKISVEIRKKPGNWGERPPRKSGNLGKARDTKENCSRRVK